MAKIVRLRTGPERAHQAHAAQFAEQLELIPDELLPGGALAAKSHLVRVLRRAARPSDDELWPGGFVMIGRKQTQAVWKRLRELPGEDRPVLVRDAFMMLLCHLDFETGHVDLTRKQLADMLDVHPNHVTDAMRVLEREGVIRRDRKRLQGVPGAPSVVYVVDPDVAYMGNLKARPKAAEEFQRSLRLVGDGDDAE
jgi:hypothetical protein